MSSTRLSLSFYMLSFIISSVIILLIYVAAWVEGWPEWTLVVIFPAICWLSVFFLLIYKAWKAIQWEGATSKPGIKVTPGRAVGFFLIPIWNIYWVYVAIYGWAKNYNAYLRHHKLNLPFVSERPFLFFVLTWYAVVATSFLPDEIFSIWLGLFLIFIALGALAINEIVSGVNRLVSAQIKHRESFAPPSAVTSACKSCGSPLPKDAKFCPNCGKRIANICPGCGKELPELARYCSFCGRTLEEKASRADSGKALSDQAAIVPLKEQAKDYPMKSKEQEIGKEMDEKEILKAYWKAKAEELSRGIDIPLNPVCDSCNKSLDRFPEDSYYFVMGNRLRCGDCTEEALARWEKDGRPSDYFGRGELENALAWYKNSKREVQSKNFGEKRLGTIHAGIGSIWPFKFCDLLFTDSRLIVAKTGSNWWIIGLILTLLLGLIGFGGFIIVLLLFIFIILGLTSLNKRNKISERLSSLPPDRILKEYENVFSIPYNEISRVEMRKSWMTSSRLLIYTSSREHAFILLGKRTALASKQLLGEYEKILRNALPSKLTGRGDQK